MANTLPDQNQFANKAQAWSARFSEPVSELVKRYTASVDFDKRLARHDIQGSLAHADMLAAQGIISAQDLSDIQRGMAQIRAEIEAGSFQWLLDLEDVHLNIEKRLVELVGDAGKRLHTGRSRNDQVATDIRLWLREEIDTLIELLRQLRRALATVALDNAGTIMPGFTHLQVAQPVTFGHHLLAYAEMFGRDAERLADRDRALRRRRAGHDARLAPVRRIGAVDEPARGLHRPGRPFCTGSSIMPQKKNPDVPELARGKAGRVNGNLVALLTLMKGQPWPTTRTTRKTRKACSTRWTRCATR